MVPALSDIFKARYTRIDTLVVMYTHEGRSDEPIGTEKEQLGWRQRPGSWYIICLPD